MKYASPTRENSDLFDLEMPVLTASNRTSDSSTRTLLPRLIRTISADVSEPTPSPLPLLLDDLSVLSESDELTPKVGAYSSLLKQFQIVWEVSQLTAVLRLMVCVH
jgi:hypothetical protein